MKTSLLKFTFTFFILTTVCRFAQAEDGWTADYAKALAQAKSENKRVLLDFTGSDWCPWCIKLEKDIYSKEKFREYAKNNLVLVTVDFPQSKPLAKNVQEQNEKLKNQFGIEGFPTTVLLNSSGKKLGDIVGYVEGGPDAFIAQLEKMTKK